MNLTYEPVSELIWFVHEKNVVHNRVLQIFHFPSETKVEKLVLRPLLRWRAM